MTNRIGNPSFNYQDIVVLEKQYKNTLCFLEATHEYYNIPSENKFKICWKRIFVEEGIEEIIAKNEEDALDICEKNILQYEPLKTYYNESQFETSIV